MASEHSRCKPPWRARAQFQFVCPGGRNMSANDREPQPTSSEPAPIIERASGIWVWSLAAGLLAGLATWVGGELVWGRVHSAQTPKIIAFPTAEDHDRVIRGLVSSTAVSFIQQGAILGAVLGLAGGLARRSARVGLLARSSAERSAPWRAPYRVRAAGGPFPERRPAGQLHVVLLVHGGIWAGVGAAAGLAFGLGGRPRPVVARGVLAGSSGSAAAMAYDVVGCWRSRSTRPVSRSPQPSSPGFSRSSVAVFVAAGAVARSDSAPRLPTSA